jgi:hypothetical protein
MENNDFKIRSNFYDEEQFLNENINGRPVDLVYNCV